MKRAAAAACGLLLAGDGLYLLAQGVLHVGAALPLAVGAGLLALAGGWHPVHAWLDRSPSRLRAWRRAWAVFALWLAVLVVFGAWLAASMPSADAPSVPTARAIVVLGSGTPGGKVSPTLAARLDVARVRAGLQPFALLVVSGNRDPGERASEAEVMAAYLREHGVQPSRIVLEERSASTHQNLVFSRDLLAPRGVAVEREPVEIVTSDFHTVRAGWIAARAGYGQVRLVPAPTPAYLRWNAWLRESFAFASGFLLREF